MDTQKILKPDEKVVIISDYREKEIIDLLKNLGANVNEMSLEVADYICSDRICVERKTHDDFVNSIIDGRLFAQAKNLSENFEKPILIVEGYSNREISENALKGAVASLVSDFNITLLNTRNHHDTAKTIFWIAKKEQQELNHAVSFKVGKKPKDTRRLQEEIVGSIPGISKILSKRLLEHFGNIEKIVIAEEHELKKVKGVGQKLAKRIKNILTKYY
ncbi:MAG: hypothetical protein HY361_05525 [Candidatus Aenigmarchaeota archaeon]|nr:hypothetical protein [Candidatus Aenigmarchaeota archaeon]